MTSNISNTDFNVFLQIVPIRLKRPKCFVTTGGMRYVPVSLLRYSSPTTIQIQMAHQDNESDY